MASANTCNRINDTVQNVADSSKEFVTDHALSTTLAAFGFGLAAGVALVHLMSDTSHERYHANIAQKVGQQIMDAIKNHIPDSLAQLRN